MIPRLLVDPATLDGERVVLAQAQSHYLTSVLRSAPGAPVELFDGAGRRRDAVVVKADRRAAEIACRGPAVRQPSAPLRATLMQGLASGDRMDWVVEKAVELGAIAIAPIACERSAVRLPAARAARRTEHWRRIAEAACMQCGRDDLPAIEEPTSLRGALDELRARPEASLRIVLLPTAQRSLAAWAGTMAPANPITQPSTVTSVTLLVGPESGLSDVEVQEALATGFEPLGLGPRILRTETAGIVALSLVQALAGDLR